MKFKPYKYQDRAIRFMLQNPAAALFLDMGLGKTSCVLAAFDVLRAKGVVKNMLVVAPLRVAISVWKDELEKWADFHHLTISVACGMGPRERLAALKTKADIYTINYDNIPWLMEQDIAFPDMLVCDESSRLKKASTKRFKALRPWLPDFKRRYCLTGTPAPNGLIDLFGQMYVVDLGESLGPFITTYRNRYFVQGGFKNYQWFPREGVEAVIYEKIAPRVMRMASEDYLELPPLHHVRTPVQLPDKAREAYETLQEEFIIQLKKGEVTVFNAGAKTTKLRQLANGSIYLDDKTVQVVHEAKLDALEELIDEMQGQPVLIVYAFQHDRDAIVRRLKCPVLGGGTSAKEQDRIIKAWNQRKLPAVAVHPASAGHGLNLQHGGSHIIWYGLSWDLEHYEQTIKRLHRQGQEDRVVVHHLVAEKTVDELILRTLTGKAVTQNSLFDALKALGTKRTL